MYCFFILYIYFSPFLHTALLLSLRAFQRMEHKSIINATHSFQTLFTIIIKDEILIKTNYYIDCDIIHFIFHSLHGVLFLFFLVNTLVSMDKMITILYRFLCFYRKQMNNKHVQIIHMCALCNTIYVHNTLYIRSGNRSSFQFITLFNLHFFLKANPYCSIFRWKNYFQLNDFN